MQALSGAARSFEDYHFSVRAMIIDQVRVYHALLWLARQLTTEIHHDNFRVGWRG